MLRESLPGYQDENGILEDKNKIIDGNALLYTGAAIVLLHRFNDFKLTDFPMYEAALKAEIKPGLLERYKKPDDSQEHDDYVGMLAASYFVDSGSFAERVVKQGRANKYCWDNKNPGKFSLGKLFVRMPGWWGLAKAASDHWLNPFDQIYVFIDQLVAGLTNNGSSGILMSYMNYNVQVTKSVFTHPISRLGCYLFKKLYMKKHPKGIKESYTDFFDANYPLAQLPDGFF